MTTSPDDLDPTLEAVRREMSAVRLSDEVRARIAGQLTRDRGAEPAGATTLRPMQRSWSQSVRWAAAAAAVLLLLVWGWSVVDRTTTVSAAEVLVRSQQVLSAPVSGVERITYDLTLDGVLQQLLPEPQAGRFTIEETLDHDHPGRLRVLKLAADGQLAAGAADDPVARTRVRYLRLGNRGMLLRFSDVPPSPVSLGDVRRMTLQILLGLMQTSANPALAEIERNGEAAYEITAPPLAAAPGSIALDQARAVVSRADARLLEFHASGHIGAQPFGISFDMRTREVRGSSSPGASDFTIPPQPGDEVIEARGASPLPVWDAISQCLRR